MNAGEILWEKLLPKIWTTVCRNNKRNCKLKQFSNHVYIFKIVWRGQSKNVTVYKCKHTGQALIDRGQLSASHLLLIRVVVIKFVFFWKDNNKKIGTCCQKWLKSCTHKNRACHSWSRCNGILYSYCSSCDCCSVFMVFILSKIPITVCLGECR